MAKLRDSVKFDDERSSKLLSENKEASPEIMDTNQEEEGFWKKLRGFFVWSSGAIHGVTPLKGEKQYNKNQGSEINHIRFPF